jgi:hypothetical protein
MVPSGDTSVDAARTSARATTARNLGYHTGSDGTGCARLLPTLALKALINRVLFTTTLKYRAASGE